MQFLIQFLNYINFLCAWFGRFGRFGLVFSAMFWLFRIWYAGGCAVVDEVLHNTEIKQTISGISCVLHY